MVVHRHKFGFVLLCFVFILKLHLDETKAPTSLRLPVAHDNGVSDNSKLFEVLNKVKFYRGKIVSLKVYNII